jgi:hypothetical protein
VVGELANASENTSDSEAKQSRLGVRTTTYPYGSISWASKSSAINKTLIFNGSPNTKKPSIIYEMFCSHVLSDKLFST